MALVVPTRIGGVAGGVLVAVVAVVLMNGVNFLDGLDTLASGTAAVGCVAFAVLLHGGGRDIGVAVAAALAGFLLYNRPPARVYLGDGGSYLLGAALALLLASAWGPGTRPALGVASLAIVAVPVGEVAFAVVRRARARQSITSGDRRHPYDLAMARGWSRARGRVGVYRGRGGVRSGGGGEFESTPRGRAGRVRRGGRSGFGGGGGTCRGALTRTEGHDVSRVYLSPPDVGDEERRLLLEALDSGWIAPLGPHVDLFEQELARRVGVPHAVALSSGTAALHLALLLVGVGPGDDVLVPTFTFVATANAATYIGARPVLVDCDAETWQLDPDLVAQELEDRRRRGALPQAVIAVDLYGQCADYGRLAPLCERTGCL